MKTIFYATDYSQNSLTTLKYDQRMTVGMEALFGNHQCIWYPDAMV